MRERFDAAAAVCLAAILFAVACPARGQTLMPGFGGKRSGSSAPAGSNGQLQYNNAGAMGAGPCTMDSTGLECPGFRVTAGTVYKAYGLGDTADPLGTIGSNQFGLWFNLTTKQFFIKRDDQSLRAMDGSTAPVTVSTSSPVTASSPGFYYNDSTGAITYNLPTITASMVGARYCARNLAPRTGAITLQAPASTYIDKDGSNGTAAGTLVSAGAAGDSVCVIAVTTTQYVSYIGSGVWTNN
jgi:hypothetical protein